jgi:hypothetical protein
MASYRVGRHGRPGQQIRYRKNDQIPKDIFARLCRYMHPGDEKPKNNLASDQSYSMAADCLLQLIQRRVTEYVRREALRRDQA